MELAYVGHQLDTAWSDDPQQVATCAAGDAVMAGPTAVDIAGPTLVPAALTSIWTGQQCVKILLAWWL